MSVRIKPKQESGFQIIISLTLQAVYLNIYLRTVYMQFERPYSYENRDNRDSMYRRRSRSRSNDRGRENNLRSYVNQTKPYTAIDVEMRCLIRKPFGMSSATFATAGETLALRTHILDLRCPELAEDAEFPESNLPQTEFDAIRVNSWGILKPLSKLGVGAASEKRSVPYVFWAPFTFFTANIEYLERYLEGLDEKRQLALESSSVDSYVGAPSIPDYAPLSPMAQCKTSVDTDESQLEKILDTATPTVTDEEIEINDLSFFINFVKKNLKPDDTKQCKFQSGEATEVAFEDLPYLFRMVPNAYVVGFFDDVLRGFLVSSVGRGNSTAPYSRGLAYDRGYSPPGYPAPPPAPPPPGAYGDMAGATPTIELRLLYVDFDGCNFQTMQQVVQISEFNGMMPVRSLKVFPIRYLSAQERTALEGRGERFLKYALGQEGGQGLHKYCNGVSLNLVQGSREPVDSPVILDHVFALQHNPRWELRKFDISDIPRLLDMSARSGDSRFHSTPHSESGLVGEWAAARNKKYFREQGEQLQKRCSGSIHEQFQQLTPVRLIMHSRVFAFVLRNRTWVTVNLDDVSDMVMQREGFDALVLPKGHKELVQALVQMHSQPSQALSAKNQQLDLVRGKGKGLIVLLHGAPGVGKTSTAECVAEYARKPLFPITCGDIGYEPQDVAKNLEDNFRLAHRWDCVLLIDEADVFLAKRDRENLKRNSLVSIFLRVLEYYPGILFLTTNRVGTFDEAFKSRIHMSLYYPELTEKAYLQVWDMNLERVQKIRPGIQVEKKTIMAYAKKKYPELQWNGRQIRNAVQTALALAEYRARGLGCNDPPPPVIGKEDFQKVTTASKKFENYLLDIYGNNDADRAHMDMLRAGRLPDASDKLSSKSKLFAPNDSSDSDDSSDSESGSDSSHTKAKKEKARRKKKAKKSKKAKKPKDSDSDATSSS